MERFANHWHGAIINIQIVLLAELLILTSTGQENYSQGTDVQQKA